MRSKYLGIFFPYSLWHLASLLGVTAAIVCLANLSLLGWYPPTWAEFEQAWQRNIVFLAPLVFLYIGILALRVGPNSAVYGVTSTRSLPALLGRQFLFSSVTITAGTFVGFSPAFYRIFSSPYAGSPNWLSLLVATAAIATLPALAALACALFPGRITLPLLPLLGLVVMVFWNYVTVTLLLNTGRSTLAAAYVWLEPFPGPDHPISASVNLIRLSLFLATGWCAFWAAVALQKRRLYQHSRGIVEALGYMAAPATILVPLFVWQPDLVTFRPEPQVCATPPGTATEVCLRRSLTSLLQPTLETTAAYARVMQGILPMPAELTPEIPADAMTAARITGLRSNSLAEYQRSLIADLALFQSGEAACWERRSELNDAESQELVPYTQSQRAVVELLEPFVVSHLLNSGAINIAAAESESALGWTEQQTAAWLAAHQREITACRLTPAQFSLTDSPAP